MEPEKWTDTLQLDKKYCGLGTATNQLVHKGTKLEAHQCEDRSFRYELKPNSIYVYGLLDGFNGMNTVDFVNQSILSDLYFDHLSTIDSKTDEEIFELLVGELQRTERLLLNNARDKLDKRNVLQQEVSTKRQNVVETLKTLDDDLSDGAFVLVSLLIDNRLFIANVGTSSCFICYQDNGQIMISTCVNEHLSTSDLEMDRLSKEGVDASKLTYTRCLGDFKTKCYFNESTDFKHCCKCPITSEPECSDKSIEIDNDKLFMIMCSNEVKNVLQKIGHKADEVYNILCELIISKMIQENSLSCAVQAVIDELRRQFDDKYVDSTELRDDMSLLVRIFDDFEVLRSRLSQDETIFRPQTIAAESIFNSITSTTNSLELSVDTNRFKDEFDENGLVKAYIDFKSYDDILYRNRTQLELLEDEIENYFEEDFIRL